MFPLAHEHLCDRMRELHKRHPDLKFAFERSVFPACTMNLGPQSVSFVHADGGDYPEVPGSIHTFGNYDADLGGHLIAFDFQIFIRFPPATLSLLSSSGLRHGNTPIQEAETRYSFTQYVSGHLMRWIAYGCKPAGEVNMADRDHLNMARGEGWEQQKARLSDFFRLDRDRKRVYARRRSTVV